MWRSAPRNIILQPCKGMACEYDADGCWKHVAGRKKPDTKTAKHTIPLMRNVQKRQSHRDGKQSRGCRGRGEGLGVTADARGRGVGSALLLNGSEGLTTSRMHRMSLDRTLSVIRMVNSL